MTSGTVQNVIGAVPVRYKRDPPEGPKALPIKFVLGAAVQVVGQLINLSDWQMSQVVSAIIDNTQSDVDIQVTMGATNTVIQVPALAAAVVPAFSNGPSFNILIQAKESPVGGEQIIITLLNFEKQPAIYSYSPIQVAGNLNANITNAAIAVSGSVGIVGSVDIGTVSGTVTINDSAPITVQNTIINTTLNSSVLYSGVNTITSSTSVDLTASANWIIDSFDIALEFAQCGAVAGTCFCLVTLQCGSLVIHSIQPSGAFGANQFTSGNNVSVASYRTWPQGLLLPRGNTISLKSSSFTLYDHFGMRVNLSGLSVP